MIKANELRIGNLVLDNNVKRTVLGIKQDDLGDVVLLDDKSTNRLCKNIEPIPLTPEILQQCGFKKSNSGTIILHTLKTNRSWFQILTTFGSDQYCFDSPHFNHYFTSVHYLQNLFNILTGEELSINL